MSQTKILRTRNITSSRYQNLASVKFQNISVQMQHRDRHIDEITCRILSFKNINTSK